TIKQSLITLNDLGMDAIVFVVADDDSLVGSVTDGDVRRGLIKGLTIDDSIMAILQPNPRYIRKGEGNIEKVIEYRDGNFRIIPVLDKENRVVNVINFREIKSYLPVDAIIMAGGRGQRLEPLTNDTPKSLLKVGNKAIMEHNVDRLLSYGIDDFWFSVKYLGEQIEAYFGNGNEKNINIKYVWEHEPKGTIGAVSKIEDLEHEYILVMNADLLTNIDYENFFLEFIRQDADMAIATIPYQVNIPYAVLNTEDGVIMGFKEKPTYTYYSNGGIYLLKKSALRYIPKDTFFDATDLMDKLIEAKLKVVSYPLADYWLDIGKHDDYKKAQEDIKKLKF
ncbi:MAG: nucleotidyltransferase family protein, partial [Bacteroidota bacterium]